MKHLLTPCKVLFVVLYARYACKLQLLHHLDTVESINVKTVKHCKYLLAQVRLSKCRQTGEGQSAVGSHILFASKYELGVPL